LKPSTPNPKVSKCKRFDADRLNAGGAGEPGDEMLVGFYERLQVSHADAKCGVFTQNCGSYVGELRVVMTKSTPTTNLTNL
jgi:hypothetical protein